MLSDTISRASAEDAGVELEEDTSHGIRLFQNDSAIFVINRASYVHAFVRLHTQLPGGFMGLELKKRLAYQHEPTLFLYSWEPITAFMSSKIGKILAFVVSVPWMAVRIHEITALRSQGLYIADSTTYHIIQNPNELSENRACGWGARLELLSRLIPPVALLVALGCSVLQRAHLSRKVKRSMG